MQIRIRGSVPPFFSDLGDAKKCFLHIFSYNLPASTLSSVLKILIFSLSFVLKFYVANIISVRLTPLREGKDPDPTSDYWIRIREAQKK